MQVMAVAAVCSGTYLWEGALRPGHGGETTARWADLAA